jgi:ribosomal protein S27AE
MKRTKLMNASGKPWTIIDKTNEYYRVCPQCSGEFMAHHMSQKFCSDKCGDDFNNAKKRLANTQNNAASAAERPQTNSNEVSKLEPKPLDRNYQILKGLAIDRIHGSSFHVEHLHAKGFDFSAFSGRGALYNIPSEYNCHFLHVGEYRLYRNGFSTVLIANTNKL